MSDAVADFLPASISNDAKWPFKPLDELCSLISRGTAPLYVEASGVLAIGQRCVAQSGFAAEHARPHSERAMRNVLRPEEGDVLLNSTGTGTIGRSAVFDGVGDFMVDGHVTVLRPKPGVADPIWLNAILSTPQLQNHLERHCYSGSTNQIELNRGPLKASSVPTPRYSEQRAISGVLSSLDIATQQTESIIAKLKAVKQGLMHDLLTRGIDANGELRPPQTEAPHLYKASALGIIPKGWEAPSLSEVLSDIDAGWSPSCPEDPPGEGEWGVLKVSAITSGWFNPRESKRLPDNLRPIPAIEIKAGDVLLARANGVAELVATTVLVDLVPARLMLSDKTLRLVPNDQKIFGFHLARIMGLQAVRRQVGGMLNGSSGQKNISQRQILTLRVPVPPREEQRLVDLMARDLGHRISTESTKLAKLRNLKAGLTDDLLTGRVRVEPLLAKAARSPLKDVA